MPILVVNILDTIQNNSEEVQHTQHLSNKQNVGIEVHIIFE
jgi:hypothetical protein